MQNTNTPLPDDPKRLRQMLTEIDQQWEEERESHKYREPDFGRRGRPRLPRRPKLPSLFRVFTGVISLAMGLGATGVAYYYGVLREGAPGYEGGFGEVLVTTVIAVGALAMVLMFGYHIIDAIRRYVHYRVACEAYRVRRLQIQSALERPTGNRTR